MNHDPDDHTDPDDDTGHDAAPGEDDRVLRLLRRTAEGAAPPPLDLGADLARGRARRRRDRALLGVAAAAVAAVVVAASSLALGHHDTAGQVATDPASSTPTGPATASPTDPSGSPTPGPTPGPTATTPPEPDGKALLGDYRDIVADHLDPGDEHLQRHPDNLQGAGPGGLGTKLGWTTRGQSGEAMVELFVSDGFASQFAWFCGDPGTECHHVTVDADRRDETDGDGTVHATVEHVESETWVAVRHHDGTVVALMVDGLFGNNSVVPLAGFDVSIDDLARTAADARWTAPTAHQAACAGADLFGPDPVPFQRRIERRHHCEDDPRDG